MSAFSARKDGNILKLRFGAPGSHNLMSDAWFRELEQALRAAAEDPEVRVIFLSAEGHSFSAGGDLRGFMAGPWPQGAMNSGLATYLKLIETFEKPFVAAVHGSAIGGGITVLLHCDFVYAADDTRFQLPFTRIGLVPELGSTCLLSRFAGQRLATELLLTGRSFDAETAIRAGVVNEAVPIGQLLQRAEETCRALAQLPPGSLRATKRLLNSVRNDAFADAWRAECAALEQCFVGEELQEACKAFLEKRAPDFSRFH